MYRSGAVSGGSAANKNTKTEKQNRGRHRCPSDTPYTKMTTCVLLSKTVKPGTRFCFDVNFIVERVSYHY